MPAQESILLAQPPNEQLEFIVHILNSATEGSELRELVHTWQAHGPNLGEMLRHDKSLHAKLSPSRCFISPYGIGGRLVPIPNGAGEEDPARSSLAMFASLVVHPMLAKFAGPCPTCSQYYLKKSARQTIYCSRRCSAAGTAVSSTRKRRTKEHKEKLQCATNAIQAWTPGPPRRDWKAWVGGADGTY